MHDSDGRGETTHGADRVGVAPEPEHVTPVIPGLLVRHRANVQDVVIVLSLAALCLIRRLETLEPVNTGGDAAIKWQFVRQWFYHHDFSHAEWNHHMTRFGVLVPAYFAQRLMGHGLRGYYSAPIAACMVQTAFVYGCGKRLSGRLAGVLAALAITFSGVLATAGSQLLPDLFTGTYAIVMLYLYLRYTDAVGPERMAWLGAAALAAFLGYLAKETMAFFYPGMALAVWLGGCAPGTRKQALQELSFFFGLLLLGLLLETAAYRVFTPYHSRLAIVFHSHVDPSGDSDGRADTTFWKLFDRFEHIDKAWAWAFHIFLPCWLGLLGLTRNYRVRALLAVVASFFFCLTFVVRSLSPLLLWHRFMSRYLDPGAPFVGLVIGLFLALVLEQMWQQRGPSIVWQRLARLSAYGVAVVVVVSLGLGLWSYSDMNADDAPHAFRKGTELASFADDAYNRNLPIVIRRARGPFYSRDLQTLYAVYMNPRELVRDGALPPFDAAKRATGSFTYLVKNPAAYTPAKVSQLMAAGCALEVREQAPFMTASPWTPLPAPCDALAAN